MPRRTNRTSSAEFFSPNEMHMDIASDNSFRRKICEFPHDDTARLVHADFTEESGFPMLAAVMRGQPLSRNDTETSYSHVVSEITSVFEEFRFRSFGGADAVRSLEFMIDCEGLQFRAIFGVDRGMLSSASVPTDIIMDDRFSISLFSRHAITKITASTSRMKSVRSPRKPGDGVVNWDHPDVDATGLRSAFLPRELFGRLKSNPATTRYGTLENNYDSEDEMSAEVSDACMQYCCEKSGIVRLS